MAEVHERDVVTGTTTTGHEWDGIKELNTPLPKWWINMFYLTILWSIGYWIVYPAWPLVSSYTTGLFGYSSRAELAQEMADLKAKRGAQAAGLEKASLEEIQKSPELSRIALAQGKAAFGDNCVPCHGVGGAGTKGYPTLADDEWLWGGSLADIQQTIQHGIRWTPDDKTRIGDMMAFGKQGLLKKDEVDTVVEYVRSLAKLDVDPKANLAKGKELFETNCASCHGDAGKGNRDMGAPNLTDSVWLYGSDRPAMYNTVYNGRQGAMPAWAGRLDPVTIKSLTLYVHSLGGGK